jgi:hypothetical protein
MTVRQRKLVRSWIGLLLVFAVALVFDDFIAANASWLRFILVPFIVTFSIQREHGASGFSYSLDELADSYSWLTVWMGLCAIFFFVGAIYVTRSRIDLIEVIGFKVVVLSFIAFLGPFVILGERERYRNYGAFPPRI